MNKDEFTLLLVCVSLVRFPSQFVTIQVGLASLLRSLHEMIF